jgi:uroporphyrinogen-III synthase
MLILVTRPEPQASQWAQQLQTLGVQACALPLMEVGPPTNPGSVHALWQDLAQHRCLMFVSPNAVQWFARQAPEGCVWPEHTLLAAPGPGTASAALEALQAQGLGTHQLVSPPADSEQFDSEHLWPLLQGKAWAGQSVVVVGGGEEGQPKGRQWLSEQWGHAGATVHTVVAYERHAPQWHAEHAALAQKAYAQPTTHAWLLSSSQAVAHLVDLMGRPPSGAVALCTHPKVAASATQAGFTQVVDTRPQAGDVAQACRQLSST